MSLLANALEAAQLGYYVFPMVPGTKTPMVKWGVAATNDQVTIVRWWVQWPDANIGIACKPSGLVIIDCDTPKLGYNPAPLWNRPGINDGVDQLATLFEQAGQPFELAPHLFTPRGGMHFYYRHPRGIESLPNSQGRLAPLIDVRAHAGQFGGLALWAGSVGPSGVYTHGYRGDPLDLPPWLAALCATPPPPERTPGTDRPRPSGGGGIDGILGWLAARLPGEQNPALYRIARDLRKEGVSEHDMIEHGWACAQQWACDGRAWTYRDVEQTVRSAYR